MRQPLPMPAGVPDSAVGQTGMLDKNAIRRTIRRKLRTWRFPAPRGGGKVVVTYPFIFRAAG